MPNTTWKHNAIFIRIFSTKTTGPIFTKILHDIMALVALFNHTYTLRYPILFLSARATSEGSRFWRCQNAPKLIGYHKTYVRFVISIHVTTYAERLTKIGLVVADEWVTIVKLKPSCSWISIYQNVLHWDYWTDLDENCTRYSGVSAAINACIYTAYPIPFPNGIATN